MSLPINDLFNCYPIRDLLSLHTYCVMNSEYITNESEVVKSFDTNYAYILK